MKSNINEKVRVLIKKLKDKDFEFVLNNITILQKENPQNEILWNLKGLTFQSKGNLAAAYDCFETVTKINPKNIEAKNNLGLIYQVAYKLEEAEKCFKECIELNSNFLNGLLNLSKLKVVTNNFDEAILLLNKALKLNEDNEMIYLYLGQAYQNTKQFEKAEKILTKVLKKFPLFTKADKLLSMQTDYTVNNEHLNVMLKKSENKDLSNDQKIDLLFSIGKAFEDKKIYGKSYDFYSKGNLLKKNEFKFNINDQIKLFKSIKDYFSNFNYNNQFSKTQKKVIFIFGLPRSGTSLIENIISSHKMVSSGGEINFLSKFFSINFIKDNKIDPKKINKFLNIDLQKEYFHYLKSFNLKNNITTDKSLNNYFHLGFIKHFFPNSKFIHCQRNPKDNCLSIYKNLFNDNIGWKYNEKDIVDYYYLYRDIMNFWDKKFSDDILNVKYENLINNKDVLIKNIIKFCDLSWDEKCLHHQKNDAPIKTLSFNQANKPIYSSSINSSKKFEIYLKNMFDKLS